MPRPFHFSLRTRLFLNLLPLVALFLVVGLCAIGLFSRLASNVDVTLTENYRSLEAVQSIGYLLTDLAREMPGNNRNELDESTKKFEASVAKLSKQVPLPGERQLVMRLVEEYNDFRAAGLRDPGVALRITRMRSLLERIRGVNYNAILAANQDIQNAASQVGRLLTIGLAVVLAISAFTCYRIGLSILRPIHALTRATRELGDGDLHEPVPVVTHDELGGLAVAFNKMAALLQEYRRSTTEEIVRLHRTMEATLASFPDPIFVLNKLGEIELKNPAAAALAQSLQLENQLPERLQSFAQAALQSRKDFLPNSFNDGVSFRHDGTDKFFLPRVLAMQDREGALFGVAVVLYDVTRFRLLDSAKTNLVATVSHELKTPLTSVRMALHLLLEKTVGGLTSKQEALLQAARDDSERLLRILNDLLDLARLEEGDADLRREKIAPVELLQSIREGMAGPAWAKGIALSCVFDPELPAISVDRHRIEHVFTNLIINAIKYSPAGSEISLRAGRDDNGGIQFSVTDQGAGVPEQFQPRIFDRFFRVPGQDKGGAGLGLSIAREITVAHGGRIGVRSAPGKGSTFFVVLKAAD